MRSITLGRNDQVADLAKRAGIHRSTLFRWLDDDAPLPSLSIENVLKIARAGGVPESVALHAAAGLVEDDQAADDEESIRLIRASDAPQDVKDEIVGEIRRLQRQAADDRATLAQRLLAMARRVRGTPTT